MKQNKIYIKIRSNNITHKWIGEPVGENKNGQKFYSKNITATILFFFSFLYGVFVYYLVFARLFLSSGTREIISSKSNLSHSQDFDWMWGPRAFWSYSLCVWCVYVLVARINTEWLCMKCLCSKTPKLTCRRPILLTSREILTEYELHEMLQINGCTPTERRNVFAFRSSMVVAILSE